MSDSSDSRISRLFRQVAKVESLQSFKSSAITAITQLENVENQKYVQKSFQHLAATLSETFKGISSGILWRDEAIDIFSDLILALHRAQDELHSTTGACRVGWWLVDLILKKGHSSRHSTLYAIHDVLILTMTKMDIDELHSLHQVLYKSVEKVDVGHSFKILSALFVLCLDRMQDLNNSSFPDFVDVVIGWMVDEQLKEDHTEFCGDLLMLLRPYFQEDPYFPKTLLNQILEDMEAALDGITVPNPASAIKRLFLLAKAYVIMLRTECFPEKSFVNESTERMVGSALKILNGIIPSTSLVRIHMMSLLEVVNEAISLSPGVDGPFTRTFIKTELECFRKDNEWSSWSHDVFLKVWEGVCVYIEGAVSVTQVSEDTLELTDSLMEFVDTMDESREKILIVHALFRTRSVSLLQKVYQWHLSKLQNHSVLFILAGLSDIAVNRSGSILSLWAMQPSIFNLLLDLAQKESDSRIKQSILNLLRCHCSIHSHFVSSLTTSGSFSSDSPGTKFLPALMTFWTEQLAEENTKHLSWFWGWIYEFLISAAPYAPALFQSNCTFFSDLLSIICSWMQRVQLKNDHTMTRMPQNINENDDVPFASILSWRDIIKQILWILSNDANYSQVSELQTLLECTCQRILEDPNTSPELHKLCQDIFKDFLVEPSIAHPVRNLQVSLLTPTEFIEFLHKFLTTNNEFDVSSAFVRSAVDHLMRSKLRTPLGKPQELFGQIQLVFKKKSESSVSFPKWKFDFLFWLEQAFVLWINSSLVLELELNDTTQSFYKTNKTPCMEWLKRIRQDVIEMALVNGSFYDAYFNATSAMDNAKVALASFHIKDAVGLKSLNEIAGWHYLHGRYETAMELLNCEENLLDSKKDTLKCSIFSQAVSILSQFKDTEEIKNLEYFNTRFSITGGFQEEIDVINAKQIYHKKDLKVLDWDKADIMSLMKSLKGNTSNILLSDKFKLENAIARKMIDNANFKWAIEFLNDCGVNFEEIENRNVEFVKNFVTSENSVLQLFLTAKLLLSSKNISSSVWIYDQLAQIASTSSDVFSTCAWNTNTMKSNVLIEMCNQLKNIPGQLDTISASLQLQFPQNHHGSLEVLLEKALHFSPTCESAWLELGHFHYDFPEWIEGQESTRLHKQQSIDAYSKYLRLQENSSELISSTNQNKDVFVIGRLVSLCNSGYDFDPTDLIFSKIWLEFLPKISQTPSLRPHILYRFPKETSLYLWCHDSTTEEGTKVPLRRKGLFDPMAFSLVDVSEEPLSSSHSSTGSCALCSNDSNLLRKQTSEYLMRSQLYVPENVRILGRELLRISTSCEEMWSWNLQRILIDWNRRVSNLKKDLSRDPDPLKVTAYVKPVIRFLEELWKLTEATAEAPAQMAFVVKYSAEIVLHLKNISICTSVEALLNSFEKLLFFADKIDSFTSNKSQLSNLSSKLANFQEWGSGCTILGIPSTVSVVGVHPIVYALATKTKPKKIRFRGSNGKSYEFLVKGNENLNVDSGMMQFLEVTKGFLKTPAWTYAVTPLGKRGGLIQMVSGGLPIFLLYKKHLQRNQSGDRTSEIFWRRMNASGACDRSNSQILKEVFLSLQSDTPKDLISKELLLCSHDAQDWFSSVKGFTRDSGVSSTIGYLLGIGDRHLDNILVDLYEGKLIHVDFSLMFDKGASLRVPEVVPFRLTQNFSSALQYPGPSGPYSVYLEESLFSFQNNEELSSLCAEGIAFSSQIEEDSPVASTAILEAEVTSALMLLQLRYKNIFKSAQAARLELLEAVRDVSSTSSSMTDSQKRLQVCEKNIETLTVSLSVLKEAQGDFRKLSDLRSKSRQCTSSSLEEVFQISSVPQLTTEMLLAYFTDNVGKKCLVTENDAQWANSMEKLISSQLQGEVQSKFSFAEENSNQLKAEKDLASKVIKKLNKWKRILANLDPLVTFIGNEVDEDGRLGCLRALVESQWLPNVAHFWLHSTTDALLGQMDSFNQQCELTEIILEEMFSCLKMLTIEDGINVTWSDLIKTDATKDYVQMNRVDYLLQSFRKKLQGFNTSTSVESLMVEATSAENLSQMFEGWTPWV